MKIDSGTRLAALQKRLRRKKYDALLVTEPYNRRYLSGYTAADHGIGETAGVLLIPATGKPYLLTDSRFVLQAEEEAVGFEVVLYPRGLASLLKKILPRVGIATLAFESLYMLHATAGRLAKVLADVDVQLVATTGMIERMRVVKSEDEIALLKKSVLRNEQVFNLVYNTIEPGMSEREIALALELTMHELDAERPSFETIVAFGENGAKPHAVPGDRILKSGEIVLIDMGLVLDGYCSDMTRTVVAGKPDALYLERLRVVRQAQLAGIVAIRPGVTCHEVDLAARQVIDDAGYGKYFGHALGHGVGLAVHEDPRLSSRSRKKLRPGMVVTVEPGIYIPGWGGIRLENMVVVREDGAEVLNEDTTGLNL